MLEKYFIFEADFGSSELTRNRTVCMYICLKCFIHKMRHMRRAPLKNTHTRTFTNTCVHIFTRARTYTHANKPFAHFKQLVRTVLRHSVKALRFWTSKSSLYSVNYLEFGKNWEDLSREVAGEDEDEVTSGFHVEKVCINK